MPDITVREWRPGDGKGVAQIIRENSGYYAALAPDYFKQAKAEGLVEFVEGDDEWRAASTNFGRIAEVDGAVAGYIEATIQSAMDSSRWQSQRDLAAARLFISFVGTSDRFKRVGVATRLVEAAEEWGRQHGAKVAICDTYIESPLSVPFWERRMGYDRRAVILRKIL